MNVGFGTEAGPTLGLGAVDGGIIARVQGEGLRFDSDGNGVEWTLTLADIDLLIEKLREFRAYVHSAGRTVYAVDGPIPAPPR